MGSSCALDVRALRWCKKMRRSSFAAVEDNSQLRKSAPFLSLTRLIALMCSFPPSSQKWITQRLELWNGDDGFIVLIRKNAIESYSEVFGRVSGDKQALDGNCVARGKRESTCQP